MKKPMTTTATTKATRVSISLARRILAWSLVWRAGGRMARRQGTLSRGSNRIQDVVEPREATGMYVLILVRVLIRIGMLDHAARRLRFENKPCAVALFQVIGNLHARPLGRPGLGPEFNVGVGLIAVDGHLLDIHHHGAHVERADSSEVLHDSGANGVIVILLLLASAGGQKRGKEPQCQSNTFHAKFLSRYIEAGLPAISVSVSLGDSPNIIQRSKLARHRNDLQSIAHEEGDANVQDGEDGEGITEGPVNDVPELKNLLRTGEKGDALGERGLFLPHQKGALESLVAGGE